MGASSARRTVNKTNLTYVTLVKAGSHPTRNLKIASFNSQSLGPSCQEKRLAIYDFIIEQDIDMFFLQETWLKQRGDEGKLKELTPPGYSAKSYPRSYHGGGLAIVFRDTLSPYLTINTVFPFPHLSFECFQVVLTLPKRSIRLWNVYRTHPSNKNKLTDDIFFDEFPELLTSSSLTTSSPTVIMGDLNIHFNKPSHPKTLKMNEILDRFNLSQSVSGSTHVKGNTLDAVIYRETDDVLLNSSVNHDLSSDHFSVIANLSIDVPSSKIVYRETRNLKAVDRVEFRKDLNAHISPSQCSTVDELDSSLRSLLDKHAPLERRKVNPDKFDPWFNDVKEQVAGAKRERRSAEKKWHQSGLTIFEQIYDKAKKAVRTIICKARNAYYRSEIDKCQTSRQLHSTVNILSGTTKVSPLPNSYSISDLPQVFCDFFIKKICDIRNELDRLTSFGRSSVTDTDPCSSSFSVFHAVSQEEVRKIILLSKPTTCSLDSLPTPFFLEFLDNLLPTITQLLNDSILSGIFPSSFKTAIVKPLLKKSTLDINTLKNYRPVSNLSFLSKILEKIVLKQLFEYLNTHALLSPNQSAYRPAHSTETALLKVTNDILTALDRGDVTFLTLLDLSAAFDTIDHTLLFDILSHNYGITGTALTWFQSYLTHRTQSVSINNHSSSPAALSFGVPQGSVLGPILFIMYTQPLHSLILRHSMLDQSFADDTQIYTSCKPTQANDTIQNIQACISDVKDWMTDHRLKLNDDKTEALLFHSSNSFTSCSKPSSILVCSSNISFSQSARNLGFFMSDNMSVDTHITHTCNSAYAALRQISSIRHNLTTQATKTLICSLVLSRLDYCNSLLIGASKEQIKRLQKVQNTAARITLRIKKYDHITPALKQLHWLPIEARIIYKVCLHCHNFIHQNSPSYFSQLLSI